MRIIWYNKEYEWKEESLWHLSRRLKNSLLDKLVCRQISKIFGKKWRTQMLSYLEIRQKDNLFAKCELEFIWTIDSQKKDYLTSKSRVVYVPLEKFKRFAPVSVGDVFTVLHDEKSIKGSVISVCTRDEEAKAKHKALRKRAATVSV